MLLEGFGRLIATKSTTPPQATKPNSHPIQPTDPSCLRWANPRTGDWHSVSPKVTVSLVQHPPSTCRLCVACSFGLCLLKVPKGQPFVYGLPWMCSLAFSPTNDPAHLGFGLQMCLLVFLMALDLLPKPHKYCVKGVSVPPSQGQFLLQAWSRF